VATPWPKIRSGSLATSGGYLRLGDSAHTSAVRIARCRRDSSVGGLLCRRLAAHHGSGHGRGVLIDVFGPGSSRQHLPIRPGTGALGIELGGGRLCWLSRRMVGCSRRELRRLGHAWLEARCLHLPMGEWCRWRRGSEWWRLRRETRCWPRQRSLRRWSRLRRWVPCNRWGWLASRAWFVAIDDAGTLGWPGRDGGDVPAKRWSDRLRSWLGDLPVPTEEARQVSDLPVP
jgi:hypothetical protein